MRKPRPAVPGCRGNAKSPSLQWPCDPPPCFPRQQVCNISFRILLHPPLRPTRVDTTPFEPRLEQCLQPWMSFVIAGHPRPRGKWETSGRRQEGTPNAVSHDLASTFSPSRFEVRWRWEVLKAYDQPRPWTIPPPPPPPPRLSPCLQFYFFLFYFYLRPQSWLRYFPLSTDTAGQRYRKETIG